MLKKLIYLQSFVLLFMLINSASAKRVLYWKFDEGQGTTAFDSSGSGYHGTFVGSPQWVKGYQGGGIHFTAEGQIVLYSFAAAAPWQSGTLTVWVKADSLGQDTNSSVFSSHVPNTAGFQIDVDGTNPGSYRMQPGGILFGAVTTDWIHLALAWNGTSASLYYNGNLAATRTVTATNMTFNQFALGINRNAVNSLMAVFDDLRVYNVALTQAEIQQAMIIAPPGIAVEPSPANNATDVPRDVVLSWTPGEFAPPVSGHKVYLSENFNDVNDGIGGITQDTNSYTPLQRLNLGTTYYWRVDEVNGPPDYTVFKGDIWSFTTEPIAYPIENVIVTASS